MADTGGLFILLLFIGIVYLAIAYWVYNDAKRKGLDAGFWGIITFILGIIGLAIYAAKRPSSQSISGSSPKSQQSRLSESDSPEQRATEQSTEGGRDSGKTSKMPIILLGVIVLVAAVGIGSGVFSSLLPCNSGPTKIGEINEKHVGNYVTIRGEVLMKGSASYDGHSLGGWVTVEDETGYARVSVDPSLANGFRTGECVTLTGQVESTSDESPSLKYGFQGKSR